MHDIIHYVFSSLPLSFSQTEMDLSLPTEEALWKAGSSREWFDTLQRPSQYGAAASRLTGFNMQRALGMLGDKHVSPTLPATPFGHFILIHAVLCSIFYVRFEMPSHLRNHSPCLPDPTLHQSDDTSPQTAFALQTTLHNWLHSWIHMPDALQPVVGTIEPRFMQNGMPYYWLSQVSLLAFQEGVPLAGSKQRSTPDVRFRVLKRWLRQIQQFLHNGSQTPTSLWDDLMKMIMSGDESELPDTPGGLLPYSILV